MGFFDDTQQALADGRSVFYGELYQLNFTSGNGFYWDGFGDLDAYGHRWEGAGQLVERSEIPFGVDDEAGELTLTMSGVDETLLAKVRAQEAEFYGRPITIWGQFFDEDLQISSSRFFLYTGTMDVPTYGGTEGHRSIAIGCEGEWADRNGSAFSYFSHNEQLKRSRLMSPPSNDMGLEYIYRYAPGVRRRWPKF